MCGAYGRPSTHTQESTFYGKKVKKFSFFVYFCALLLHLGHFLFFILFAKTTPLFSCHRICPDEGNSVSAIFRGIFPVQ